MGALQEVLKKLNPLPEEALTLSERIALHNAEVVAAAAAKIEAAYSAEFKAKFGEKWCHDLAFRVATERHGIHPKTQQPKEIEQAAQHQLEIEEAAERLKKQQGAQRRRMRSTLG